MSCHTHRSMLGKGYHAILTGRCSHTVRDIISYSRVSVICTTNLHFASFNETEFANG